MMNSQKGTLLGLALFFLFACEQRNHVVTSSVGSVQYGIEQSSAKACPAAPQSLVGAKGPKEACASHGDCRPVCCGCPSGTNTYLGAVCKDGRCAEREAICGTGPDAPATDASTDAIVNNFCR